MKWEDIGKNSVPRCDVTKDLSEMYELHTEILDIKRKLSKLVFAKEKRKRFDNLYFIMNFFVKQMEEKIEKFYKKYVKPYEPKSGTPKDRFTW